MHNEVLLLIKRHPYRVLNKICYLRISLINDQDYFVLNEQLNVSLTEEDIEKIKLLLEQKTHLYYSKIDVRNKGEYVMQENENVSEIKVETVFFENRYWEFRDYCRESNIIFILELEPVDFVAFRSRFGATIDKVKEIKDKITQIKNGDYKPMASKEEITNSEATLEYIDKTEARSFIKDKSDVFKNNKAVIDDNEIYIDGDLCINNQITHIKDLEGFEFNKRIDIRGFGVTRVEKIVNKYNEIATKDITENNTANKNQKLLISEKMRRRIEQLIQLNDDSKMCDEFTEEELIILDKVSFAVKELEVQICQMAYLNPQNTKTIIGTLETFSYNIIIERDRIEKLQSGFQNINESNKYKKVYPLVMAYTADCTKNKILIDAFNNSLDVVDLSNEFESICKDDVSFVEVLKFMEWLKGDLKEWILNLYLEVFKKDNYKEIINCRANGGTLKVTGRLIGVTRERVRQIEKKIQEGFDYLNNRKRFMWIISAYIDGETMIDKKELSDLLGEDNSEFIYLIINSQSIYYSYSDDLKVFIIGEKVDVDKLKEFIHTLPDIIFSEELNGIIENIVKEFKITTKLAQKAVDDEYKLSGQVYHNRKISLTEMYSMVLQKYYPTGTKLFDEGEQERFRRYIIEMFGNVSLPSNNRALDARIADIAVLCDRGTYIHPDYIKTNIELIEEIKEYIKNGEKGTYAFFEIFEHFKEKLLLNSNINNRYFLQGVLKLYYKNEFYCTRDMISNSLEMDSIDNQIEEFVSRYDVVTKDQLRREFTGITEAMLFFVIGRCKEVISVENGIYMHTKHLNIIKADYEISKVIDDLIVERPISSRKLLEIMYTINTDFLNRNFVFSNTKLFGVLQYMFRDTYKFSRPFIAKKNTENITNIGFVRNYLKDRDSYEISELINFCEENHVKFVSWATLIDELSDEFIRVDRDFCVRIEKIDIDEEKIETIKNVMKDMISNKGYISARKIKDFIFFPKIDIEWNGYILKSIIEKYVAEIEVLQILTSDTFSLSAVFVNDDCGFENYEELLRSIVKSEHNSAPFKDMNEIKQWLQDEELINQNIPKIMFDKSYLYVDEFGKIIVE